MQMNIRVARSCPVIRKYMNIMTSFGKLMNIALNKLFGPTIKDEFLPDDGYFHCVVLKDLRIGIVQNVMINGNSVIHHFIRTQFVFAKGVGFPSH